MVWTSQAAASPVLVPMQLRGTVIGAIQGAGTRATQDAVTDATQGAGTGRSHSIVVATTGACAVHNVSRIVLSPQHILGKNPSLPAAD